MCSFLDSSDRLSIIQGGGKTNKILEINEKEDYRVIPSHWNIQTRGRTP